MHQVWQLAAASAASCPGAADGAVGALGNANAAAQLLWGQASSIILHYQHRQLMLLVRSLLLLHLQVHMSVGAARLLAAQQAARQQSGNGAEGCWVVAREKGWLVRGHCVHSLC